MWARHARLAALFAAALTLGGCKVELYSNLSEEEANEIVSVLDRAGVSASRALDKDGVATVTVEEEDFSRSVETLKAQGYPKRAYLNLGDVFQGDGFVVSQMEERARFIFAMTEELSRTIAEIDGVLSARVHVVLPTSEPVSRDAAPSSASVAIRHLSDAPIEALLPQIKMLVANSIEGLSYEKVSVVLIPVAGRPAAEVPPPAPAPPAAWERVGVAPALGAAGGAALVLAGLGLNRALRRPRPPAVPKVTVLPAE